MPYQTMADFAAAIEKAEAELPGVMELATAHDLLNASQRFLTPLSSALLSLISTAEATQFPPGYRVSWVKDGREYRLIVVLPGKELPPNDGEHD